MEYKLHENTEVVGLQIILTIVSKQLLQSTIFQMIIKNDDGIFFLTVNGQLTTVIRSNGHDFGASKKWAQNIPAQRSRSPTPAVTFTKLAQIRIGKKKPLS